MKNNHEIILKQYAAYCKEQPLYLGTAGSYGMEMLTIIREGVWAEYDILAAFHPPVGAAVQVRVGANNQIGVPIEATAEKGMGEIVFAGYKEGVRQIAVDVLYKVAPSSGASGTEPAEPTPNVVQQIMLAANAAEKLAQSVCDDADVGKFTGAKGDKGDTGKDAVIDTTLTNAGQAADAAVVVNRLSALSEEIENLSAGVVNDYFSRKFQYISYSYVGEAATNSLEHFRWCAANDYDGIKCDIRVTSDSKLVLCHDAGYTFDDNGRITAYDASNCTMIRDMTYDEVMSKEFHNLYNGSYCHPTDLETYLKICKEAGKIAYITIRDQYMDEVAPLVVSAIENIGMVNHSIINSFTMESLSYVRTLNKNLYLSLVIDPFSARERTTAYEYATSKKNCMICLYYTNNGHTISELAGNSDITAFINDCINSGIQLYGAQCADESETSTLLDLCFSGVQTKVKRPAGDSLNLSTLTMETVSGEYSTTLILSDAHQNNRSVEIPKMNPTDAQVQAGVESWMDKNATPIEVWSKNVLNVNDTDVSMGYIANAGQINSNDSYWVSGYIPAKQGDVLRSSLNGSTVNFYYVAEYNSAKGFLTRATGSANTYTVTNGSTAYIRVSWKTSAVSYQNEKAMLTLNNPDLTFEEYGSHIEGSLAPFLVLESPNGTKYTISVNDDGTLSTTLA